MERLRSLTVVSGLAGIFALALSVPVLAKVKEGEGAPAPEQTSAEQGSGGSTGQSVSEVVLADAIRLCQFVVEDDRAIIEALQSQGWTHDIDYNVGNAPYYKELSAEFYYEDIGAAEIWGFMEDYPGYGMGYCSFKITDPDIRFSIDSLNEMDGFVGETQTSGEEVFGAWREDSDTPMSFVHAYHNSDTFTYQITRINKTN